MIRAVAVPEREALQDRGVRLIVPEQNRRTGAARRRDLGGGGTSGRDDPDVLAEEIDRLDVRAGKNLHHITGCCRIDAFLNHEEVAAAHRVHGPHGGAGGDREKGE
jgi:hypothetical protein